MTDAGEIESGRLIGYESIIQGAKTLKRVNDILAGSMPRILRRVVALASGAMLLQASGCTIDQTLLTEFVNLTVEALLTALTGTT